MFLTRIIITKDDVLKYLDVILECNNVHIQKLSQEKGGLYSSTGGHVLYNETSNETIAREIKEELEIEVKNEELKYVGDILLGIPYADIYYLEKDIDINNLSLQKEEVDSISYMKEDEIYNLILKDKMLKSHGLIFMNYFMKLDNVNEQDLN